MDVGTGDGRFVRRAALAEPDTFVIGIDAVAENMRDASRRAPANALFVRAAIEAMPEALAGIATHVTVLFPWGSLLRAVWSPDGDRLHALRTVCAPGARLDVVVARSPRDEAAFAGLSTPSMDAYREAGFEAKLREIATSPFRTTWSQKLAFDPARRLFALEARAI